MDNQLFSIYEMSHNAYRVKSSIRTMSHKKVKSTESLLHKGGDFFIDGVWNYQEGADSIGGRIAPTLND